MFAPPVDQVVFDELSSDIVLNVRGPVRLASDQLNGGAGIQLDRIAFYGRCLEEYRQIFDLNLDALQGRSVLDCPAGAASFCAEANMIGIKVTAVDPKFEGTVESLLARGRSDIEHVLERAMAKPQHLTWSYFDDLDHLASTRYRSLDLFTSDFETHGHKRYIPAELPLLPFEGKSFDLVLSGHLLFAYGEHLSYHFHLAAISELVRASQEEARCYPIRGLDLQPYQHWDRLVQDLKDRAISTEVRRTNYESVAGWNELAIFRRS